MEKVFGVCNIKLHLQRIILKSENLLTEPSNK